MESVIFRSGMLWGAASDENPTVCTSRTNPPAHQSCVRLEQVNVTNPADFTVLQDAELNVDGLQIYYPALTSTLNGDLYISMTASSSTTFASAAAYRIPAGQPVSGGSLTTFGVGDRPYQPAESFQRWGDYSGAALDPNGQDTVWLAAEYGGVAIGSTDVNWATAIGHFSPT